MDFNRSLVCVAMKAPKAFIQARRFSASREDMPRPWWPCKGGSFALCTTPVQNWRKFGAFERFGFWHFV